MAPLDSVSHSRILFKRPWTHRPESCVSTAPDSGLWDRPQTLETAQQAGWMQTSSRGRRGGGGKWLVLLSQESRKKTPSNSTAITKSKYSRFIYYVRKTEKPVTSQHGKWTSKQPHHNNAKHQLVSQLRKEVHHDTQMEKKTTEFCMFSIEQLHG